MDKLKAQSAVGSSELVSRLLDEIPTNWCDPLLTGPDAALPNTPGKWGCPDIERLLLRLRERMHMAANAEVSGGRPRPFAAPYGSEVCQKTR